MSADGQEKSVLPHTPAQASARSPRARKIETAAAHYRLVARWPSCEARANRCTQTFEPPAAMPAAHIVSFLPLDYRSKNPMNFAAALAGAGWRARSIELDGVDNRFASTRERGVERLILPFGRESMARPLHAFRRIMRYVYFIVMAIVLRWRVRPGDLIVAYDGWSLFLTSLVLPLERVVFYEVEIPNHLRAGASPFERYLRGFLRRRVRDCALLISVERNRTRFLSKYYRNPRTMVVLNAARLAGAPRPGPKRLAAKPRIIYAGRLWRFTLGNLFLEFVARHQDSYEIDIFGNPESDCRDAYEKIRNLPGVTCHGFAPRAVLDRAMEKADAALVLWDPVGRENFGLRYCAPHKFFEAVEHGIPVVCSPNPPLREWIGEYRVGEIIEPLTADGLHAALTRLLEPAAYDLRRRECRRAFEESWNFEAQMAPVIERLRQMSTFITPTRQNDGHPVQVRDR
jgi:glycosyltransferase involved in cell wall biosynthesis